MRPVLVARNQVVKRRGHRAGFLLAIPFGKPRLSGRPKF